MDLSVEWDEVLDEEIMEPLQKRITKAFLKNFALQIKEEVESTDPILGSSIVLDTDGFAFSSTIGTEEIRFEIKWESVTNADDYYCVGHSIESLEALLRHLKKVRKTLPKY